MIRPLALASALTLCLSPLAQAAPLKLDFLPPDISARDVCVAPEAIPGAREAGAPATQTVLTDADRLTFLRRDIRNYTAEDANRFFDFVNVLIDRQRELDDTFTAEDALFARIDLMLSAGRIDTLEDEGLVPTLLDRIAVLTNNQKVALARLYTDGIGVPAQPELAQELIRDAAYGGSAPALLEIARMQQQGTLVEDWDAPLDLTVTMAFGGILGPLDRGVCNRAGRIAQEYLRGDVVQSNPALALAWFRFAADLGGADAAWRVVEFQLNADGAIKDNLELRRYLKQAVRLGVAVDDTAAASLVSSGAVTEDELAAMLGFNHDQDARRTRAAIAPLLQLTVNIDAEHPDEDGLYLDYLRELAQLPQAPGRVFDRLAAEVLVRQGRWAGEAEALPLLEEAVRRSDGPGTRRLARMLMRHRDDAATVARVDSLLSEAVSRHGLPEAMHDLDRLYRCQVNDAPRVDRADHWASAYRASGHGAQVFSAADLLALAPGRAPESIAHIQTLALDGRAQMLASQAQRVQANPLAADQALRFWAARLNRSDKALEEFAELEFSLATTPQERDLAIEFFRRVHLNNGVTTALDLAIALVEYDGRNPDVAAEIVRLLTMAGNRGEGAAIRLLSRLRGDGAATYASFADAIEARGDFLAMMFAIPHVTPAKAADYIDRAVSLMSCSTKDVEELADAHAILGDVAGSFQWQQIGLTLDGGHVLSKLRLSDGQMGWYERGAAQDPVARATRDLEEGDNSALMRLVRLTANPDLPSYDAAAASDHMLAAIQRSDDASLAGLAALYRAAPEALQIAVDKRIDMVAVLTRAAQAGDPNTAFALAELIRVRATAPQDLATALDWFERAAEQGHRDAMYETGHALGFGIGRDADIDAAQGWLARADDVGHPQAEALSRLLKLQATR
ncbi:MAG: hypothetical protein AAGF36_06715 [Pseudomonadota bacterium]